MKEIHGVADAQRIAMARGAHQEVRVRDGHGEVELCLSECSYPAGLSPEQARFIAAALIASADRIQAAA